MSTLRNLLIDCRIALRGALGDAAREDLAERIDKAIREVTRSGATPEVAKGNVVGSAQVALAWQTATRALKRTHSDLYDQLNERVMALLDTRTLSEPTEELLKLEEENDKLRRDANWTRTEVEGLEKKLDVLRGELDALYQALAEAVPELADVDDPQKLAMLRMQQLVLRSKRTGGISAGTVKSGEGGLVPSRTVAEQVAAGARSFTSGERDWSVGEALGLTGWEMTPVELIEKGDAWLARLLLEKGSLE
jgi:hypothetical protein